ncbi:MAG: beta-lactamase family protein [Lachnospiraceae bacterium]|nr:beta-lactamase family protein [Lachnospiraceae bacterium]
MSGLNETRLTEYLDSLLEKGIPSVDCMVCKDHKVIYRHLNGTVDIDRKKKVVPDQLYLMFSMTKVQTMTAMMQLIEQGKVSMDDAVSKFLPAYANLKVEDETGIHSAKETMRIWHLLSMQSGLDYDLNRPGIQRVLKEKGQKAGTREIVDSFAESPLKFEPGTKFLYSLSHDVAAAIIEVVSGMSFGDYMKKNLWEPLGMKDTFFAKPMNDGMERLAQQYIMDERGIVPMDQSCVYQITENYESGGAGLISCTEDYVKLGDALSCGGVSADGARILKPETVEIIKQNLLCEAGLNEIRISMGRKGYGYGCGMQIFMHPEAVGSPAPAGIFGWDGAAGSCIQMDTASKTCLVYTQHVRNCGPAYDIIHPTLRDLVFG